MSFGKGQQFIFKIVPSKRVKADTILRYLFASDFVRDKAALDAACGSGFGTFFLAQEAQSVLGLDYSQEAVFWAKKNYAKENIEFNVADLLAYDLPKNAFDVIVSFHTIEQTADPKTVIDKFKRALKNDGLLIISTPNKKIVSPFGAKPIGKFHQFEFYKKDLIKLLSDDFNIQWFGQRISNKFFANYAVRRAIRAIEVLTRHDFGFFGRRESMEIKPLKPWHEPKEFVLILTKKNAD